MGRYVRLEKCDVGAIAAPASIWTVLVPDARTKWLALVVALLGAVTAGCGRGAAASAGYAIAEEPSLRRVFVTDSGMHGLWSPEAYQHVGERNWEAHFVEDAAIEAHIEKGEFVPINVRSDGAPVIDVRVGSKQSFAGLSGQEKSWLDAASDPYLFVSNGIANVSGIEYIGGQLTGAVAGIRVPPGRWQVVVHLLRWPENDYNEQTRYPPDFVVTLNPESGGMSYRQLADTFDEDTW